MILPITGQRIKELRLAQGLTLEQLGEQVEMKKNSVSSIENCKNPISLSALVRFANYFNVSVDYLLGRTDNPRLNK